MEEMGVTIDNRNTNILAEMPISVENVQEMVRKDPSVVPERFVVKNDIDRPNISLVSSGDEIPIIDLSLISDGNQDELKKLDFASSEWGFFQVINHDVEEKVLSGMRDTAAEFFNLPLQEKIKYATQNDLQGYGHGQAFAVSKKKTLDWTDCLMLFIYPLAYRNPKYWPTAPLEFKDAIEAYSAGVNKVGEKLLGAFSVLMGMNTDSLQEMHQGVINVLRMNYYPTCSLPDEVLGVSPHSDASSLTILTQDVAGLQIRHNGGWVSVNPIPNALVVNIGDALEIWSNGKYRSIEHRVITNTEKTRTSFASFITPSQEIEIGPLDQMIDHDNPVKMYKKMKYGDFVRGSFKEKYEGKGHTKTEKFED